MLNKKYKLILGIIIAILLSTTSVYAVTTVIESKEVVYDNSRKGGSSENVQGSIDELYTKIKKLSGVGDEVYKDSTLKGSDPVLGNGMIPVIIDDEGKVKYASRNEKWYDYSEKEWANAVILVGSAKERYNEGSIINEDDIESYFVWIPRYKYKIWNTGKYDGYYELSNLKDAATGEDSFSQFARGNTRIIEIVFENKDENASSAGTEVGEYLTHPAFKLGEKNLSGIWVGKFEVGKSGDNIIVKPNVTSWRNETVGTFFNTMYGYKRNLESHMMKNIEWGAVAYLSHSIYGKGSKVNINNNSNFITGYSAGSSTDQTKYPGETGTSSPITEPYNTATGYLASTTGNISGIYDMSGGTYEYMAAYMDTYGVKNSEGIESGFTNETLKEYEDYLDKYSVNSTWYSYSNRKLGDATGEMGPFYYYYDADDHQ